jgi:hypothetical protein
LVFCPLAKAGQALLRNRRFRIFFLRAVATCGNFELISYSPALSACEFSFLRQTLANKCKRIGQQAMASPLQQKLRVSGPVVITANRLSDGAVVHRTKAGLWTESLSAAEVFWTAVEAQSALKEAQADFLAAVGPYVAPINAGETAAQPGNLREFIRASGPTFALPSDVPEKVAA